MKKIRFLSILLSGILAFTAMTSIMAVPSANSTVSSAVLQLDHSGDISISKGKTEIFHGHVEAGVDIEIPALQRNTIYTVVLQSDDGFTFFGTLGVRLIDGQEIPVIAFDQIQQNMQSRTTFSSPQFEVESNNSIKKANALKGDTIYGKIEKKLLIADEDYFKITIPSDGDYAFVLDNIPGGKDYDLALYNSSSKQIATSATTADMEIIKIENAKANAIYYAKVEGYKKASDNNNTYRLQYTPVTSVSDDHSNKQSLATDIELTSTENSVDGKIDYPKDVDFFAFTAQVDGDYMIFTTGNLDTVGTIYDASGSMLMENDNGINWNFSLKVSLTYGERYFVAVKHTGVGTGAYTLNIHSPEPPNPAVNLGDSLDTATPIAIDVPLEGWLDSRQDSRYVIFTPTETGSYGFYTISNFDTYGVLRSSDNTILLENDNAVNTQDFIVAQTMLAGEPYYIQICTFANIDANSSFTIHAERYDAPRDDKFSQQWHLLNTGNGVDVNILPVWKYFTGTNITVGVADTGTYAQHVDLKSNMNMGKSYNFIHDMQDIFPIGEASSSLSASGGHGTHVAGIIAAAKNGVGSVGIAPNASIASLKVLGSSLSGYPLKNDIVASIESVQYALQNGISIVNMSLGGSEYSESEHLMMQSANDILFVIAAGNRGKDLSSAGNAMYPACYYLENSIVVANSDANGNLASISNYGGPTHIAAPGTGIMSTMPYDSYRANSGTSMAAPVVTGIATLVKEYNPTFAPKQIRSRIISTSNVDLRPALSGKVGSGGTVNAFKSVLNEEVTREPYFIETDANQRAIMSLSVKDRIKQTKDNASPESMTQFVIVKMDSSIDKNGFLAQVQRDHGFTKLDMVSDLPIIGCIVVECESNIEASRAVDVLNVYSEVVYAEPDYVREIHD